MTSSTLEGLARRPAAALALGVGALGAALVWWWYRRYPQWSDFDQIWLGARALLEGHDPYAAVGRGDIPWPLYYPAPALLVGIPFALVPLASARVLFAGFTAGVAAWAIFRTRRHAWPMLASAPFAYALIRGQWSPLLVAAALLPSLGGLLVAKPSIGAALALFRPSGRMVAGGLALLLLSLILLPRWPMAWLHAIQGQRHFISPVLLPFGFVLLLGFLRWRTPEGRLLSGLVCVPQTPAMYELVPLGLVPTTRRQALGLAILLNLLFILQTDQLPANPEAVPLHFVPSHWPWYLALAYAPALLLVLHGQPAPSRAAGAEEPADS